MLTNKLPRSAIFTILSFFRSLWLSCPAGPIFGCYPVNSSPSSVLVCLLTTVDLMTSQASDSFCQNLRKSTPLTQGLTDESDVLFFRFCPVLPAALKDEAFELLHANPTTGYMGTARTIQRFSRLFYLPNLHQ
ncbi:hypothetical protein CU097_014916 [Rhizopus azygosporus]|uniref:Uncharacterized protein n=1 Tax=Rhizopus azygosporus TaxID=86630 RepID=A0A367KAU4_RHIAZ|nr:hypothetical protein CU097_014916 [Rhizopus azygosporus]